MRQPLPYLLQLRLFRELPYQLRIRFVPGSVPFEESEKHPCVQEMFFSHGNGGFLTEHLVCKNVQPWLRVSFASTSQSFLYLVPYRFGWHLSCSFTCCVFLCLFILFILLCLGWPFCILAVSGVPFTVKFSVCLQCGRPRFNLWVGMVSWRRKRQPTPVLLPGESHGWRSLVGYSPWGREESDRTERLHFHFPCCGWGCISGLSRFLG